MTLVTYHIEADHQGKLRESVKIACNFWNRFVKPVKPLVIRLGVFDVYGNTIASACRPYGRDGVQYGKVGFNKRFIETFSEENIASVLVHEIGHTLGIGWSVWLQMFSHGTGKFKSAWVKKFPELANMKAETAYGPGTTLVHWDEELFPHAMMSGLKSGNEVVLPITIDIMEAFGHTILERLTSKTSLSKLMQEANEIPFSRTGDAKKIDRAVFVATEIWEEIYDNTKQPLK